MPVRSGVMPGEEGVATGGAALLGVVCHHLPALGGEPVNVGRLAKTEAVLIGDDLRIPIRCHHP